MKSKIRLMLIEDEDFDKVRVEKTLKTVEHRLEIKYFFSDGKSAVTKLLEESDSVDVIIMDFQIAGGLMGEALIRKIKEINPVIQIIVITKMTMNITDFDFANSLLEAGAFWYCTKYPIDVQEYIYQPTDFIISIYNAFEKKILEEEKLRSNNKLQKNVDKILKEKQIIGSCKKMQKLLNDITLYADSSANILIIGPSGSGKELVANYLHYKSNRKFENFIAVNCGSIPFELIESELFGYEKGAFTGAQKARLGLFEQANHGTLFLDEIAELPLQAQSKLLRVLEEGEIEKIGRTGKTKVDVKVVAATNKNLKIEVDKGKFRKDLYYRLNVLPIEVPPLSERSEDIPLLFDHFLERYSLTHGLKKPVLSDSILDALKGYNWPGNVRELKSVAQRLILSRIENVTLVDILNAIGILEIDSTKISTDFKTIFNKDEIIHLKDVKKIIYQEYIKFVRINSDSDADAAKKLGIAASNYSRLCTELGIK